MRRDVVERAVGLLIRKAESDFWNIRLVMTAPVAPYDTVHFHAQQGAEKYLKALLTYHGVPFPKTHDLVDLVKLLPHESMVPQKVGNLTDLTYGAVDARYLEDDTDDDRERAEALIAQAETVRAAVRDELARLGYRLDVGRAS